MSDFYQLAEQLSQVMTELKKDMAIRQLPFDCYCITTDKRYVHVPYYSYHMFYRNEIDTNYCVGIGEIGDKFGDVKTIVVFHESVKDIMGRWLNGESP